MKFLHTADLHLGKRMNEVSLMEDQQFMLAQIVDLAREEAVDGLILTGDIYDKTVPSTEAVESFDKFIRDIVERDIPLLMISGNHDSGQRLGFVRGLLARAGVHIVGTFDGNIPHVTLMDEIGPVHVHMLPFIKPGRVAPWFSEADSYQRAVEAALTTAKVDFHERNILMAHQFVTAAGEAPLRSESETITVGGLDQVDASLFDGYDYVALGHLHGPQAIGRNTIRYAGSPLKYSFSEVRQHKSVTLVTLGAKGEIIVETRDLHPLRDMLELRGPLEELLKAAQPRSDFVRAILTDQNETMDASGRLKVCYPNLLRIDFEGLTPRMQGGLTAQAEDVSQASPLKLMEDFFQAMHGREMSDIQQELAQTALAKEGEYEAQ